MKKFKTTIEDIVMVTQRSVIIQSLGEEMSDNDSSDEIKPTRR